MTDEPNGEQQSLSAKDTIQPTSPSNKAPESPVIKAADAPTANTTKPPTPEKPENPLVEGNGDSVNENKDEEHNVVQEPEAVQAAEAKADAIHVQQKEPDTRVTRRSARSRIKSGTPEVEKPSTKVKNPVSKVLELDFSDDAQETRKDAKSPGKARNGSKKQAVKPSPDSASLIPGTVVLTKVKGFPAWPGIVSYTCRCCFTWTTTNIF